MLSLGHHRNSGSNFLGAQRSFGKHPALGGVKYRQARAETELEVKVE